MVCLNRTYSLHPQTLYHSLLHRQAQLVKNQDLIRIVIITQHFKFLAQHLLENLLQTQPCMHVECHQRACMNVVTVKKHLILTLTTALSRLWVKFGIRAISVVPLVIAHLKLPQNFLSTMTSLTVRKIFWLISVPSVSTAAYLLLGEC